MAGAHLSRRSDSEGGTSNAECRIQRSVVSSQPPTLKLRRAKEVREHGVLGSRRVDGPTAEAGGE
jgi:hypothetical protein